MKDALGHGSNGVGGGGVPADRLQRFVTLGSESAATRNKWLGSGHPKADLAAAQELAQNRPHAAPAPIHPAFGRRT